MQRMRSGFLMLALTVSMLLWVSIVVTPAKAATVVFDGLVGTIGSNLLGDSSALGAPGTEVHGFLDPVFLSGSYTFNPGIGTGTQLSSNVSVYSNMITNFHKSA